MDYDEFTLENRIRSESANGFNHKLDSWSLSDWLTATAGELGEAANIIKKLNRIRDGVPGNSQTETEGHLLAALHDELADVEIYLNLMMQAAGAIPSRIIRKKFNKTSAKIGYPKQI